MTKKFRSQCPIASALDILGDKWTLVIIRDMLFVGKKTFKELSDSDEKIASNILSNRLKLLESHKIITKSKIDGNNKTIVYTLTEKGVTLAPVLVELVAWSSKSVREFNPKMVSEDSSLIQSVEHDKNRMVEKAQAEYRKLNM